MPTNLTDNDSFGTATGPIGTDVRDAAGVRGHLQVLADRARYLYNRINPLADFAALKAINTTGMANTTQRYVSKHGWYELLTASVAGELEPFVLAPTTGPGRWHSAAPYRTTRTIRIFPGHHITAYSLRDPTAALSFTTGTGFDPGNDSGIVLSQIAQNDFGGLRMLLPDDGGSGDTYAISAKLDVPDGVTITSVVARLLPVTRANLPNKMPRIAVLRTSGQAGTLAAHLRAAGAVVDPSTPVASYNAEHSITYTPDQNNVVDRSTYSYEIVFLNAYAADIAPGDLWRYVDVTFTAPDIRGSV